MKRLNCPPLAINRAEMNIPFLTKKKESETIDQDLFTDNLEIYNRIRKSITDAEKEILVVSAWFTDQELLTMLESKLSQGVKIEVIISDNTENQKLNFQPFLTLGGTLLRVKGTGGFGMMHHKYSIFDQKYAIHGSYNWSVNARTNNQESVIGTNDQKIISNLLTNFSELRTQIQAIQEKDVTEPITASDLEKTGVQLKETSGKYESTLEYERVLDSMISAEVSHFDRVYLRNHGYERAEANNGDHNILSTALDSLYSIFINDINVVEDKKKRLLTKIDEQKIKSLTALKGFFDSDIVKTEKEFDSKLTANSNELGNLKSFISVKEKEKAHIGNSA